TPEHTTSENLGSQLGALFEVLNTPKHARRSIPDTLARLPYVNGAIFAENMPTQFFTPDMRDALLNACRFSCTNISSASSGRCSNWSRQKKDGVMEVKNAPARQP